LYLVASEESNLKLVSCTFW